MAGSLAGVSRKLVFAVGSRPETINGAYDMNLDSLGYITIAVGSVITWGTAGIPPGGFSNFRPLLREYEANRKAGDAPTADARMAYLQLRCYQIGGAIVGLGLLMLAVAAVAK